MERNLAPSLIPITRRRTRRRGLGYKCLIVLGTIVVAGSNGLAGPKIISPAGGLALDADTKSPLEGVLVESFDASGSLLGKVTTDAKGWYPAPTAGTVTLVFSLPGYEVAHIAWPDDLHDKDSCSCQLKPVLLRRSVS